MLYRFIDSANSSVIESEYRNADYFAYLSLVKPISCNLANYATRYCCRVCEKISTVRESGDASLDNGGSQTASAILPILQISLHPMVVWKKSLLRGWTSVFCLTASVFPENYNSRVFSWQE